MWSKKTEGVNKNLTILLLISLIVILTGCTEIVHENAPEEIIDGAKRSNLYIGNDFIFTEGGEPLCTVIEDKNHLQNALKNYQSALVQKGQVNVIFKDKKEEIPWYNADDIIALEDPPYTYNKNDKFFIEGYINNTPIKCNETKENLLAFDVDDITVKFQYIGEDGYNYKERENDSDSEAKKEYENETEKQITAYEIMESNNQLFRRHRVDGEYIKQHLKLGMSEKEVIHLLYTDPDLKGLDGYTEAPMWRYDFTREGYQFDDDFVDAIDMEGIEIGDMNFQLLITWNNKAVESFSIYTKEGVYRRFAD